MKPKLPWRIILVIASVAAGGFLVLDLLAGGEYPLIIGTAITGAITVALLAGTCWLWYFLLARISELVNAFIPKRPPPPASPPTAPDAP